MASTLKKGPLQVSIKETYTLNGREHAAQSTVIYNDIRETTSKIITCPAGAGTATAILDLVNDHTKADVRYIRITNLDDGLTGFGGANAFNGTVQVRIFNTAGTPAVIQNIWLSAGSSSVLTAVFSPDGVSVAEALGTISIVNDTGVDADAIAVDIEVFVASV